VKSVDSDLSDEALLADGCLSIPEAVAFSRLSRSQIYEHIRAGDFPTVKNGRRRLVPRRALIRFLAERIET
jgi:predicted DNA-binding transcriptional regulator AlpA